MQVPSTSIHLVTPSATLAESSPFHASPSTFAFSILISRASFGVWYFGAGTLMPSGTVRVCPGFLNLESRNPFCLHVSECIVSVEVFVSNWLLNECGSSTVLECLLQVLHSNSGATSVLADAVAATTTLYIPSP